MKYILAFDLGTSGNKAVLVDEQQNITAQASAGYRVHYAPGGCAHIDCEEMWESCVAAARELTQKSGVSRQDIAAIGLSGIMNGCIAVDDAIVEQFGDAVLRDLPCYWHTLDRPEHGLAYCGITLIPPESLPVLLQAAGESAALQALIRRAIAEKRFVIHFGL